MFGGKGLAVSGLFKVSLAQSDELVVLFVRRADEYAALAVADHPMRHNRVLSEALSDALVKASAPGGHDITGSGTHSPSSF